ncbi:hypothetical protein E1287_37750 [Actinomadura sp. KC06]|uniref:hypothetical protein n=1 Tax=Actinomadura sp. KC06 TaxID=2530369 RepID=UPI001045F363|nr:hypothetical protein [Actinomadura sp. KC06]TDD25008.1 hypothetical protein E1287_37750 [Actinomadura sp. KC06]
MSQEHLAEQMRTLGFPWQQTTVHKTENAARPIRLNEALALTEILRMNLGELLSNPSSEQPALVAENADLRRRLARARAALDEETR